jgi:hypothetical protein
MVIKIENLKFKHQYSLLGGCLKMFLIDFGNYKNLSQYINK